MNGREPIVLNVQRHDFFEHADIGGAKEEAARLATQHGGTFVVYVPVIMVQKPQPVEVTSLVHGRTVDDLVESDLPF